MQTPPTDAVTTPRPHGAAPPAAAAANDHIHTSLIRAGGTPGEPSGYPFADDPALHLHLELRGVNYANYEQLKELDPTKRHEFDTELFEAVWTAFDRDMVGSEDVWVKVGPGTVSALLLRFESGRSPWLLDADWSMRIHIAVRAPTRLHRTIFLMIRRHLRSPKAMDGVLFFYQRTFGKLVDSPVLRIVNDDEDEAPQGNRIPQRDREPPHEVDSRLLRRERSPTRTRTRDVVGREEDVRPAERHVQHIDMSSDDDGYYLVGRSGERGRRRPLAQQRGPGEADDSTVHCAFDDGGTEYVSPRRTERVGASANRRAEREWMDPRPC